MTVKDFSALLASELMDRGISREDAASHVLTLAKTLTEEDLKEITQYKTCEDFEELTESLAEIIKAKNLRRRAREGAAAEKSGEQAPAAGVKSEAPQKTAPKEPDTVTSPTGAFMAAEQGTALRSTKPVEPDETADDSTRTFAVAPAKHTGPWANTAENAPTSQIPAMTTTEPQEIILGDDSTVKEKTVLTARGKTIFALSVLLTSPLWLAFSAATGILFLLSVCTVCAVIVMLFVLVLAEVAAGGGGFFVGLIYGAVKIFNGYTGTGLYEMGIGVACVGVTFVLSFLTYSVASKTMPNVLKDVLAFWGIAVRRLGQLIERFREECNKL